MRQEFLVTLRFQQDIGEQKPPLDVLDIQTRVQSLLPNGITPQGEVIRIQEIVELKRS